MDNTVDCLIEFKVTDKLKKKNREREVEGALGFSLSPSPLGLGMHLKREREMVESKGRKHADFVSKLWGQRFQRRLFEWGNSIPSGRWRGKGEEAFMCDCDSYACVNKSVSFFFLVV